MTECFRCEKSGKEVRLIDAIYENEIVKICERCAIVEGIPIIKKPTTSQLKDSERSSSVYERLKRISGLKKDEEKHESILDQLRQLEEHPELEEPEEKKPFNLIDNFHWQVMRARRNRGLSPKQLAWMIGESETAIKMIEKQELPEDAEKLIRKLEQFFQIKIRERTLDELEEEEKKRKEKLRKVSQIHGVDANELEEGVTISFQEHLQPIKPIIQEQELDELEIAAIASGKNLDEEEIEYKELKIKEPARVLSFKPEVMKSITISDLKELKEEREREERLAAIEEERKKALQADALIKELGDEKKHKRESREKVALEMKDFALGKIKEKRKTEIIEEKRKLL